MKRVLSALVLASFATAAHADTISADALWKGVSSGKTELAQVDWWNAHMGGTIQSFTGIVQDVSEGVFSGYWVTLDLASDHSITVNCGLSNDGGQLARSLHKGDRFTCHGTVAGTWSSFIFGGVLSFNMTYLSAEQEAVRAERSAAKAAEENRQRCDAIWNEQKYKPEVKELADYMASVGCAEEAKRGLIDKAARKCRYAWKFDRKNMTQICKEWSDLIPGTGGAAEAPGVKTIP